MPRARLWHRSWACHGTQPSQWTQAARRESRVAEPLPVDLVAEVAKLRRENQELRDTNELLKAV